MTHSAVRIIAGTFILFGVPVPSAWPWGAAGHVMVARVALGSSEALPSWFREAGPALAELSNVPDRWRDAEVAAPALAARRPEHFFDLDVWGDERLPPDRWSYVTRAAQRRLAPEAIGFLPFALREEYGALVSAFADARARRPGGREAALAAAGMVAHLAGDAAVPLHASRHHHGWVGPDPRGYTRDPAVHIRAGADAGRTLRDVPHAVDALIADSLAHVVALYEAERTDRIDHDDRPVRTLVRQRLGAGATLLARLWTTAWVVSGR
jgi:hypothetical protein